jgi:RNA polymerase II subunit A-like phosphatase
VDSPSTTPDHSTELDATAMLTQNNLVLEAQLEERPLAKKQEELQDTSIESGQKSTAPEGSGSSDDGESTHTDTIKSDKTVRKALLKNDDVELERVSRVSCILLIRL